MNGCRKIRLTERQLASTLLAVRRELDNTVPGTAYGADLHRVKAKLEAKYYR